MSTHSTSQEFPVRVPRSQDVTIHLMKFNASQSFDLAKSGKVMIGRENNLRDHQIANDVNMMPKFGAGSEFGREEKDEARRKKYGISRKAYDIKNQPWHLKTGIGKDAKTYKGVKEGAVAENAKYYMFVKTKEKLADGKTRDVFDAYPVDQWYSFLPELRYKALTAEQAEEEFQKRDKTLNLFGVMVRNRLRGDAAGAEAGDDEAADADGAAASKAKGRAKGRAKASAKSKELNSSLVLTELDDYGGAYGSDADEAHASDDASGDEGRGRNARTGKLKEKHAAEGKSRRRGGDVKDEEAFEESDEGDFDDREMDYITSSSSSSESEREEAAKTKYAEVGVDEERGLLEFLADREADEIDWADPLKDAERQAFTASGLVEEGAKGSVGKKNGSSAAQGDEDSKSGAESSSGESEVEEEPSGLSALFLPGNSSRPHTPTVADGAAGPSGVAVVKRKATDSPLTVEGRPRRPDDGSGASAAAAMADHLPAIKRAKTDSLLATDTELNEDMIRRYLMRKPMRTRDLIIKLRQKRLPYSNQELVSRLSAILKRLNPEKRQEKGEMFLYIPE